MYICIYKHMYTCLLYIPYSGVDGVIGDDVHNAHSVRFLTDTMNPTHA